MAEDIRCPRCGSKTVVRTAQKGSNAGRKYYVCTRYPDCKGKVPIPQVPVERTDIAGQEEMAQMAQPTKELPTEEFMQKVNIEPILDPLPRQDLTTIRFRCKECGKEWFVSPVSWGKVKWPRDWWRCPNRCNFVWEEVEVGKVKGVLFWFGGTTIWLFLVLHSFLRLLIALVPLACVIGGIVVLILWLTGVIF